MIPKKYIAFNKPYEVLCQFTKPFDSDKTTLASFGFPRDVYPLGRLDFDSEGLLILSDDGRLNRRLFNPKDAHVRTYYACVENIPTEAQLQQLCTGVMIEGKRTLPAKARLLSEEPIFPPRPVPIRERKDIPTSWIELQLIEGRNRQVRKMTAALGCPTLRLVRVAIGKLNLLNLNLEPGKWRLLSKDEFQQLFERSDN